MGIATAVHDFLQAALDQAWNALPDLMSGLGLIFGAGIGLYFVMVMLSYMWTGEASKLPIMDLFKRFFFLVLACTFALNTEMYVNSVKVPILAIPDEVGALVSNNNMNSQSIVDNMLSNNFKMIADKWEPIMEVSFWKWDFGIVIQAVAFTAVVGIVGTAFVVLAMLYLLVAKVMINVVLILGPAFIMFGFFPPTREYLMKWVGVVLNYIFLVVIYAAVFTMLHNVLTSINFQETGNVLLTKAAVKFQVGAMASVLLFVYLLFLGIIMAVPAMASSLTGGVGISPFGQIANMASKFMPKMPKTPGNTMGRTG